MSTIDSDLSTSEKLIEIRKRHGKHRSDSDAHNDRGYLLERIEELEAENKICKSAIENAYGFINSLSLNEYELETDHGQASVRCVLRELNESIGKATPRLLMEKLGGQKIYGLKYKELKEQLDRVLNAETGEWHDRPLLVRDLGTVQQALEES